MQAMRSPNPAAATSGSTPRAPRRCNRQVAWARGLTAASWSVAADTRTGLSGDWCDLRTLADGRIALFIGDAMGHGPRAATVARNLRGAVRALIDARTAPSLLLDRLDELTTRLGPGIVTILIILVDPLRAEVEVFSAGHLPPLVVTGPAAAAYLDVVARPPLGAGFHGRVPVTTRKIPARSTVIAFTDGLVERRGRGLDQGMEAMRQAAALLYGETPEAACNALAAAPPCGPATQDDATVVVARLTRPQALLR
jgi:serine phosphatase RsbU (regulator of sigma subunit)